MDRTIATRSLTAAGVVGVLAQGLLVGAELGLSVPLLAAATLAAALGLAGGGRRIDRLDLWLPIAALVVSAMVAIRSDPTLVFLDIVTAAALLGASMAAFAGAAVTRRSVVAIVALGMVVLAWTGGGILRLSAAARRTAHGPGLRDRLPSWAGPVARGLFLAVPVLLVFIALFSSADAIFASLTAALFGWQIDLGELPIRAFVAFLVAWVVAGLLGVAAGAADLDRPADAPRMQSLGAAAVEPLPAAPRLGVTEALTVLVAVDVLFAVFVGLQVAYLFGGLDTLAAGGITYANYARTGFFELVTVTCLAGGLVVGLNAVITRRSDWFVVAAVALAALTFVILASAAFRLRLYQEAYGWTELRFYIYATIGWLAIGIVAASVLLVRDRMRWLIHTMTIAAVAVLIGVNVVGPQRHVAEQNVARLLDPALVPPDGRTGLDVYYAETLEGFDAVPALVAALPALGASDKQELMLHLAYQWNRLHQPDARAWPAWNLARDQARRALQPLFSR
jgi:hypothetical protein